MKDATTGKTSKTDWEALKNMSADRIRAGIEDDPDATPTDEVFWEKAEVVMPKAKQAVTMRLDVD